ncbi:MAG: hypothetical protein ACKVTZ_09055 [Bacteroidia bacterium]
MVNFREMVEVFLLAPKRLFLLDGLGALLSSFLLGVVLVMFQPKIGMPESALSFLALLAVCFCIYSLCCYFFVGTNWRTFLTIIAIANIIYTCLSIGFMCFFAQTLTLLGWVYFIGEVTVLAVIIKLELDAIRVGQKE